MASARAEVDARYSAMKDCSQAPCGIRANESIRKVLSFSEFQRANFIAKTSFFSYPLGVSISYLLK